MSEAVILAYPGCTWTEVAPAVSLLHHDLTVRVAGPSRGPVRTSEGVSVLAESAYAEVDSPRVVVVPGGDVGAVIDDPTLHELLRRAVATTTVGGICHGVLLLARAGALAGRRCTHTDVPRYAPPDRFADLLALATPMFAGSTYVDEDVVVDGALVTAKPWAALDFAKILARVSGVATREVAASRARYLRGLRDASGAEPYTRWAALLSEVDGVATTRAQVEAHVEHLRRLEAEGRLELAGPFPGRRSGLVVIRARDEAEARALAEADPFVREGARTLDLRRWLLSNDDDDHLL